MTLKKITPLNTFNYSCYRPLLRLSQIRASKISYNPLSIVPGQSQTITVTFPQTEKVSSAVIFIDTDNLEKQKLTLKKTNDSSSNIWAGTWTPVDTINNRYRVRFYFVGSSGTYDVPTSII